MFKSIRLWFAIRASNRAWEQYDQYQRQPSWGSWSVGVATALRLRAESLDRRVAQLVK